MLCNPVAYNRKACNDFIRKDCIHCRLYLSLIHIYLIIEQTEALSVIDVNSGKNVTKAKSMEAIEASALKTNLEAADKLCQQIKVRNLSGIIIVDFINMNQRNCDILMMSLIHI